MDKSHFNMYCVCRICLQNAENPTSLFSETKESKEILKQIYLCFQIVLNSDNCLPSVICSDCVDELSIANKFRLRCVTFEERFTDYKQKLIENKEMVKLEDSTDYNLPELPDELNDSHQNDTEMNTAKNVNYFKCDTCDKALKTKASLEKHIISMHKNRKHVGRITGTGANRRYHCTKCSYVTPHSQTLVNHMRRHDGLRPFHCECGQSFTQSSSLMNHQKTHQDVKLYTCSTCGKQFKHLSTLKIHQRVHELGSHSCNICQKVLKSQQSLQEHMLRHYNIRNYSCEDCGATFVACSGLLNHKKTHSVKKEAECHLCGFKTRQKKNLVMHLKRHAGEKAFRCDQCNTTVYSSSDLRRHARVHSGEKRFPCPACPQRLAHSSSLNKHVRTVHGMHYKWGDGVKTKQTLVKTENRQIKD